MLRWLIGHSLMHDEMTGHLTRPYVVGTVSIWLTCFDQCRFSIILTRPLLDYYNRPAFCQTVPGFFFVVVVVRNELDELHNSFVYILFQK